MACWTGFGDLHDGRPFWTGNFAGSGRDEILFWFPGDQNYWLGQFTGTKLTYTLAGNTSSFGGAEGVSRVWVGNFTGSGRDEILFSSPSDGNWWIGRFTGNQLAYSFAINTGMPLAESFTIHFKSLLALNPVIANLIDAQYAAMAQLFAEGGIAAYRGTTEDLSGNANLANLVDLDVGQCLLGLATSEQVALFANRNNVARDDLVIYIVRSLTSGSGNTNFVGCATHPSGRPGATIVQNGAQWLLAHEVGHVLGLAHVPREPSTNRDFLMWLDTGWTNVPPDISGAEASRMLASTLTRPC